MLSGCWHLKQGRGGGSEKWLGSFLEAGADIWATMALSEITREAEAKGHWTLKRMPHAVVPHLAQKWRSYLLFWLCFRRAKWMKDGTTAHLACEILWSQTRISVNMPACSQTVYIHKGNCYGIFEMSIKRMKKEEKIECQTFPFVSHQVASLNTWGWLQGPWSRGDFDAGWWYTIFYDCHSGGILVDLLTPETTSTSHELWPGCHFDEGGPWVYTDRTDSSQDLNLGEHTTHTLLLSGALWHTGTRSRTISTDVQNSSGSSGRPPAHVWSQTPRRVWALSELGWQKRGLHTHPEKCPEWMLEAW